MKKRKVIQVGSRVGRVKRRISILPDTALPDDRAAGDLLIASCHTCCTAPKDRVVAEVFFVSTSRPDDLHKSGETWSTQESVRSRTPSSRTERPDLNKSVKGVSFSIVLY